MKGIKNKVVNFVIRHGKTIAACAFAFVAISANSSCLLPFGEPQEPKGLKKFSKFA